MQGWRKRMEDSHISDINVGGSSALNVFGVFDGHGGNNKALKPFKYEFIHFQSNKTSLAF